MASVSLLRELLAVALERSLGENKNWGVAELSSASPEPLPLAWWPVGRWQAHGNNHTGPLKHERRRARRGLIQ